MQKTRSKFMRLVSVILAASMCFFLLPTTVLAEENGTAKTYTRITSADIVKRGGEFILAAKCDDGYYALGNTISSKINPVEVNVSNDTITADSLPVWTVESADDSVSLISGANYLAYNSSTSFKSSTEAYAWNVTETADGTFRFTASSNETRAIAYGISQGKFGAYAASNTEGYVFDLMVFKAEDSKISVDTPTAVYSESDKTVTFSCSTSDVTYYYSIGNGEYNALNGNVLDVSGYDAGTVITYYAELNNVKSSESSITITVTDDNADDESDVISIADAKALEIGTENITVEGTVIYISGKNVYVQDDTAGIDLFFSTTPSDISIGDVIRAAGTRASYNGLEELSNVTEYEKLGSESELPSRTVTIDEIIADQSAGKLESTRVYIENAVIGTINTAGYTTLTQGDSSINIYKIPASDDISEGDTISLHAVVGDFKGYQLLVSSADDIKLAERSSDDKKDEDSDSVTGVLTTELSLGDQVVIYYPASALAITSTASGSKLTGTEASVNDNTVTADLNAAVFTVRVTNDNCYTFENNGKYLTSGASGSSLSMSDKNDYSLWKLVSDGKDGFYIKNVNAKYGSNEQYLEYYSGFTTYGFNNSKTEFYTYQFFKTGSTEIAYEYDTDASLVYNVAQWGGSNPYADNITSINGDRFEVGDMKDSSAFFTTVVKGVNVKPYTSSSTSTGGTNYYMGGTGLGSGSEDYMQFALSAAGWGDMTLSFRLRASNTGSGEWQLQYSVDGEKFENFTNGSYSYSYTSYGSDGTSTPVSKEGTITDGVAKTSLCPANYVNFNFDVPAGAENAETLYIRLVPSTEINAKGTGAPGTGGVVRIDSVVLSGSPIADDSITAYVKVTPDGIEEDNAPGTELTMTSSTENAQIKYRFVNSEGDGSEEWLSYDENSKPVLPDTLPVLLEVYAKSEGRADSISRILKYAAGSVQTVKMSPNGGGVYISGESAEVKLSCATEGATIYYSTAVDSDGNDVFVKYDPENQPVLLNKGFEKLTIKAYAVLEGFKDSTVTTRIFTERASENYNIYFGQLHSHTSYSDGAGTAEDAYSHASQVENLDFLAVTDHSNSFDNADSASISDGSMSEEWNEGRQLAQKYTTDTFVGLFGFEMTWSNGLGHINTYKTDGFQSRTQTQFTNYSTALQNYYAVLKTDSESISQFNHPGTTFGDFSDFAYYDEEIDQLITLIEVGNGEGAVGSSGYFPSYEYYTRALDKGWHVAPTNNQDNHKGLWGDANTARSVALADSLTEDDIYDAMRNYRIYATEDNDLSVYYTLNDYVMGSILSESDVDDTVTLSVKLSDPTDTSIGKVEVIVNGGYSLASTNVDGNSDTVSFTLGTDYSYYYIKITEADGDIAVTAPVWIGEVEAVGISDFSTDAALAVQNEPLNLTLDLYNNENSELEIDDIIFTIDDEVIHTADLTDIAKLGAKATASYSFSYSYDGLGATNIYATVYGTLNGVTKVYQEVLQLNYVSSEMVTRVVVDGTHYNDYVTGYYGGNMNNFTAIAAGKSVEVSVVTDEITAETLENCALLVISAPAKKSGTANAGDYVPSTFDDDFIKLVSDYVEKGGSVIVCGLADYQDSRSNPDLHSSEQINKLLAGIGSTLKINDDEAYDLENNGGQAYRLYPSIFNTESEWTSGIVEGQAYSQYSGCTVDISDAVSASGIVKAADWLVKGFDTTYSIDSDLDGEGGLTLGEDTAYFMASQNTVYGGTIFVSGGVFLSDFEVAAELDNIWDLPYANRTIAENILDAITVELPLSTIGEVRKAGNAGNRGDVYRVQGYVTSGTAVEENTFFDCIYIQDETGGLDIFPYAEAGLEIGTKVEIIGYLADYQGDLELKVMNSRILSDDSYIYEPELMTCSDAMNYENNGGKLIEVQGTVKEGSLTYNSDGTLAQFVVVDENGDEAKVFIDGYILSSTTGKNELASVVTEGSEVSAVGLLYMHPEGDSDESVAVLRVRNCDEIVLLGKNTTALIGDVNNDGTVNVHDATYLQKHLADYKNSDGSALIDEADEIQHKIADFNGDGYITIQDATSIQKYLAD